MKYYGGNFPLYVKVSPTDSMYGEVNLPSSKSSSIRAILTSSLTNGKCHIANLATGNNTTAMIKNCMNLGASFTCIGNNTFINGVDINNIDKVITFNPENSGIVLRLLMGVAGYLPESYFITSYINSLAKRSQKEMISALQKLNVHCTGIGEDGFLPIKIKSSRKLNSYTEVSCRKSSQFLSGLLYLGAVSDSDLHIKVIDEITAPSMVHTTINNLSSAGVDIGYDNGFRDFFTSGKEKFKPSNFSIGSDPASASAILALCSSLSSNVILNGFFEEELGNGAVINYLIESGASITSVGNNSINIKSDGKEIIPLDFDGSLAPDAVPALVARAAFANGKSVFYNIEHIRYKESNRISDYRLEMLKIGIKTEEENDKLIIYGKPNGYEGNVIVDGHYDHALIMGLTTIGLHCKNPILIKEPYHVGQTYPEYFSDIYSLGADVMEMKISSPIQEDL